MYVCECTHIYALYMCVHICVCIYIYTHTHAEVCVLSLHMSFLWVEDKKKCGRELHNPISSFVGEVIYLI